MRLLALHLQAFGPFTERRLNFDGPPETVHVVLGPNEAGKSTTLRAFEGFCYGIPMRSGDGHLHPNEKLRIGATLESAEGEMATFYRRKGNAKTLLMANGTPLPDDTLAPFLGGIGKSAFEALFCLDFHRLSEGSEEILQEGGELGRILFDARSKVSLRPTLDRLREQSDRLYKGSRAKSVIKDALKEYDDARQATRKGDLKEFGDRMREKEELERQRALAQAEQEADLTRERHLRRFQAAFPSAVRRRDALRSLDELGVFPELPDGFSENVSSARATGDAARADLKNSATEILESEEELRTLEEDAVVWARRTAIDSLVRRVDAIKAHERDLPDQQSLVEAATREARTHLGRVRPGEEPLEATLDVGELPLARLRNLIEDDARLRATLAAKLQAREKADADLARLRRESSENVGVTAPRGLIEALAAARLLGDVEATIAAESKAEAAQKRQCEIEAHQLGSGGRPAAEFIRLPVPSRSVVAEFAAERHLLQDRLATAREKRADSVREIEQAREARRALLMGGVISTSSDLQASRRTRTELWSNVREAWLGSEPTADAAIAESFERSVDAVDQIADRLRTDAQRVSELEALDLRIERAQMACAELETQIGTLDEEATNLQARWAARWEGCGIVIDGPEAMDAWHERYKELTGKVAALQNLRDTLDERIQEREAARAELGRILVVEQPSEVSLAILIERAARLLDDVQSARGRRESVEAALREAAAVEVEDSAEIARLEFEREEWKRTWAVECAVLRLPTLPTTSEAQIALDAMAKARERLTVARAAEERAQSMHKEIESFADEVRALVAAIDPDRVSEPPLDLVDRLAYRLQRAERADALRIGLEDRLVRYQNGHRRASRILEETSAELQRLQDVAGAPNEAALDEVLRQDAARRELRASLRTVEANLDVARGSQSLEAFCTEVLEADPDALEGGLEALEASRREREARISELSRHIGICEGELRHMDEANALVAMKAKEMGAVARIRSAVRPYLVYSTAEALVAAQIEEFRQANQGPILARAGEIFAALTGDSFERLAAELDDKDVLVLIALRRGDRLRVEALSSATRVALYLALRLACLYHHAETKASLPFVADDILLDFDDARARRAMLELGRLAETTQVILLTHHRHLAEIGRECLGPRCKVHEL